MSEHLTSEERAELDDLMYDAGCTADGKPRPSHEIGPRLATALKQAANQAHRQWAGYLLDDILVAGALARWKSWHRRKVVIDLGVGRRGKTVITTKAAAMSVKRRDLQSGRTYFQSTLWEDMSRPEVQQVIDRAKGQIRGESQTIEVGKKVLVLLDKVPTAKTAAEAAAALGTTVKEYLAEPAAVA